MRVSCLFAYRAPQASHLWERQVPIVGPMNEHYLREPRHWAAWKLWGPGHPVVEAVEQEVAVRVRSEPSSGAAAPRRPQLGS